MGPKEPGQAGIGTCVGANHQPVDFEHKSIYYKRYLFCIAEDMLNRILERTVGLEQSLRSRSPKHADKLSATGNHIRMRIVGGRI